MALILPAHLSEQLLAACAARLPEEACGLLIGRRVGAAVAVTLLVETRNAAAERRQDRFEVHPEDFLRADQAARAAGEEIFGVWHCHPESRGCPSATDLQWAWSGWSYVIVGRAPDGGRELRSWRLEGAWFKEEELLTSLALASSPPTGEHLELTSAC
jgi:proteasome lid subunit RPN8/RPN11